MTLLVYSGLPDPVWWIHPHHEKFKEIKELLEDARVRGIVHRHEHAPAILGYRGFLLHHPQAEHADLILGRETTALQNLLLGTMPEGTIHHTLHQKTSQAIDSGTVSPNLDVPS